MGDFVCDTCDKMFTVKKSYNYHIEKKVCTKKAAKEHVCKYCDNKFSTKNRHV